jgi:hypothetical protein
LLPQNKARDQPGEAWERQAFDEDSAYLMRLNERVQEGKLTPEDRDYLWQAYLVRIQGTMPSGPAQQARAGPENYWTWPFVLPSF